MRLRLAAITRVSIGALGVAVVAGAVVVSLTAEPKSTFFAGGGSLALILTAAGICLLATGLLLLRVRPTWPSGSLLVLAAGLWFSPAWVAWRDGPPIVRSLAMVAAMFTPLVLAWIIAGFPDAGTLLPRRRRVLGVAGAALAVAAAIFAVSYDPFLDVGCWATCSDNALLILSVSPLAETAMIAAAALGVFVLGFATVCALRDVAVRRSTPQVLSATGAAALLIGAAPNLVIVGTAGWQGPGSVWAETGQHARAIGAVALALAILCQLWLVRRRRNAIDDIVRTTSGAGPNAIQDALRRAVGDSTLSLAYWLPESQRFVDGGGQPWQPPEEPADVKTVTIARQGRTVAAISHNRRAEVESHLGPALRVAIENEALRVELEVQLAELRAARTRIVVAQDDRRRELERALHDGAQHRLTVLVIQLRVLADRAGADGERCADDLRRGIPLARAAIDELRELAHGVYPAILESGGLPSALMTYTTGAPIAVELDAIASDRVDRAVEMTAYRFVVSAVEGAARRFASHAAVSILVAEGTLTVAVTDDAADAPVLLPGILDRVGAVGGTVHAGPGRIVGELPCGS